MTAWLCDAGVTLRRQIDRRWADRDKRSDGWVGDAAHTTGDHVPDPTSSPPDVVRAIDIDEDLHGTGTANLNPDAANVLFNQLIECAREGRDGGRLSYVIFEGRIASGTYRSSFWTWRPYSGVNPHDHHLHVSFTRRGDHRGRDFPLPIFYTPKRRRLSRLIDTLTARLRKARAKRKAIPA